MSGEVAQLLEQLIFCSLADNGLGPAAVEFSAKRIYSYASRLLATTLGPSTPPSEFVAMEALRRKFEQRGCSNQLRRVEELQEQLTIWGRPAATGAGLLALLSALPSRAEVSQMTPLPPLLPPLDNGMTRHRWAPPAPLERPLQLPERLDPKAQGQGHASIPHDEESCPPSHRTKVKERDLVRDALYACQAVDGMHVAFDPAAERGMGGFALDPGMQLPRVQRHLLLKLCEVGWLFRRVQDHVDAGADSPSAIRQAFVAALQRELASHYFLLSRLDTLAMRPLPTGGEAGGKNGVTDTPAPYLTLRRLWVWLEEPAARLRMAAALADAVAELPGGHLLRAAFAAAHHGQATMRATVERCLQGASVPLLGMIRRWLCEGRLDSTSGDFFISASHEPRGRAGWLWRKGYVLDEAMRPPYLSSVLLQKILRAGKSINFLRECCGDSDFIQSFRATELAASATRLSFNKPEELERLVEAAAAATNAAVVGAVLGRACLLRHCAAIKRYLLLGQGDFVAALMEGLGAGLARRGGDVSEYECNERLAVAVRASSAQYDDLDTLARLRVRLDRAAASETGWDVFSLVYEVEEPAATVLTAAAAAAYQRVARLLWALKRAEHSLNEAWHTLNTLQHALARQAASAARAGLSCPGKEAVWMELRRCHALRNEMSHLVANLQSYLMYEVVEHAWDTFAARAEAATDLDGLIEVHETYLAALVGGSLLSDAEAELQRELTLLLRTALNLLPALQRLLDMVNGAAAEAAARLRLMERRTQEGGWARYEDDKPLVGIASSQVAEVRTVLNTLTSEYSMRLRTFVALLPIQTPVDLNFLLFRLEGGEKTV